MSDFYSLYSHEFVRVACCVPRTRVADAAYNLAETLKLAAQGDRARAAVMVFPELGLSAYAIDDLLLQDALLDERSSVRSHRGRRGVARSLFPVAVVGAPLRRRRTALQYAVVDPSRTHSGRGPEDLPAELPRVLREAAFHRAGANAQARRNRRGGRTRRSAPTCCSPRRLCRLRASMSRSARTSGCRFRPRPLAALAGATLLLNLSASNITIGKADARRAVRSQSAAAPRPTSIQRRAGRVDHRSRLGRPER
jgi:NAD+ synthase (glutamine-hydrolysing)